MTVEKPDNHIQRKSTPEVEYPHGWSFAAVFIGLFLAVLCMSLDRTIVGTAAPKITTEFHSLPDVGWYGSAYLFGSCCFQLFFGKLFAEFNVKWIYLIALGIFEVGSVVCATASSSTVLIFGRVIAGIGTSGILSGSLVILSKSVPLHNRAKYTGLIGSGSGIGQVVAPTLGGVFADYATWRWCFWINIPIGGITFAVILLLFKPSAQGKKTKMDGTTSFRAKFDLLGTVLLMPWVLCLLFALFWGGTSYSWGNWRIVLLLCLFGVFFLAWGCVQIRQKDKATIPLRILKQRSMAGATWLSFVLVSMLFIHVYYLPIWFQVVKNESTYRAGVDLLTISASLSITAICTGFWTNWIGYYAPPMILCSISAPAAAGLIYTFDAETSKPFWIGSLVFLGISVGLGAQQTLIAVQSVFEGADIPLAMSALIFTQTLGSTIFLSVGQNVFQSRLVFELRNHVPEVDPQVVIAAGASGLVESMRKRFPDDIVAGILISYAQALRHVFLISVILASLSIFGAMLVEWTSVKRNKRAHATSAPESPA